MASSYCSVALLLLQLAAGIAEGASSNSSYGTFESPSAQSRPRFRYWLPDPSVDITTVQENIKSAGSIGAGGIEFIAFYNYGGQIGGIPPGSDWSTYGFGTKAFKDIFVGSLQAHKDNGMTMDFAIGPNQGQGVPADFYDDGLQWDLSPHSVSIPGNTFNGTIPGWGTGELVALVSAEVVSAKNMTWTTTSTTGTSSATYTQLTLKNGTLADQTSRVSSNGSMYLQFVPSRNTYRLFAFYQSRTHEKNLDYARNVLTTIFDNGSYAVDHFSPRGAQTVINFWEQYILTDEVTSLLKDVGRYAWEDSIEIKSNISWTPSLPQSFYKKLGYSIKPFLPLILFRNDNPGVQTVSSGSLDCILDTADQGQGYVNDYRGVLVDSYREYLQTLTNWVHSRLGLQMSAQVSYNLPMDMEANIPFVDAPECESLGFLDRIDAYRQYVGPAQLSGKTVISNEMGAQLTKAYKNLNSELLWSINRATAGGVNEYVLHGQAFTGDYYGTTWPGYTAFNYLFSEQYSVKQPAWDHGFGDLLDYIARLQYTQQQGTPGTDVAIYNKVSLTEMSFPTLYSSTDLSDNGYTYNYISPDNFALPQAVIRNNVLGPEGPAYKALIIESTSNLTLDATEQIQRFAESGLPVVLSGGDPGSYPTKAGNTDISINEAISKLKQTKNVYSVAKGQAASKLAEMGIIPQVTPRTNGTCYTTWRQGGDNESAIDYLYAFADGKAVSGELHVVTEKTPFWFNLWTGSISPIIEYQQTSNGRMIIPFHLEANQTTVIGFTSSENINPAVPSVHIIQAPRTIIGYKTTKTNTSQHISAQVVAGSPDKALKLSNGKDKTWLFSQVNPAPKFTLSSWDLVAEHWEAPSNMYDASVTAVKHNTTHHMDSLVSWAGIPALVNVSGIGYYTTNFTWPPPASTKNSSNSNTSASGAYITFPPVTHALRVSINGKSIPVLDYNAPRADIGPYLRPGQNIVLAIVPTTMWNYIRSIINNVRNTGQLPTLAQAGGIYLPGITDNGLRGPVEIVPYVEVGLV